MSSTRSLATVTLFATAISGCYTTWDINPKSMVALGGFREGETRRIWTAEEDPAEVKFTSDTEIKFRDASGGEVRETFRAVDVQRMMFVGIERDQGTEIKVDLSRVSVEAKNFSTGKTVD